jgi:peptidoglycan/LPS O-acetylase OafA/YrhL
MFFLQNYVGFLWNHTWSLAVEEHFYLMLPLLLVLLVRFGRGKANPFAGLPLLFMVLAGAMLCLRIMTAMCSVKFNPCTQCYPTHLRIDSLMFGVCCSYYYHWKHEAFVSFFQLHGPHLRWIGIILLVPAFILPLQSSPFLYTAGFTLLYVASGLLLCSTIVCGTSAGRLFNGLAFIGTYSYSIYLWHMPMNNWGLPLLQNAAKNVLGVNLPATVWIGVYLVGSILFGIAMAKLIEFPVLRLRDRFFPARTASLEPESVLSRQTAYEGNEVPGTESSVLASTDSLA